MFKTAGRTLVKRKINIIFKNFYDKLVRSGIISEDYIPEDGQILKKEDLS